MSRDRIIWADELKGWLIILVVLGHAIQAVLGDDCQSDHLWNIIYSFHMPAFMAISGWLAFRPGTSGQGWKFMPSIRRRAVQLLLPYFLWSLIKWIRDFGTVKGLAYIFVYPDNFLWFLWVLFWICFIFNTCRWVAEKMSIDPIMPVLASCIVLMGAMVVLNIRYFGFQFIAYYFLFYTLGYCIHRFPMLQVSRSPFLAAMAVAWALLAWSWNIHGLPSWIPAIPHVPESLVQYGYRGLTAAIAIICLFGVAPKLSGRVKAVTSRISRLGIVSLGIYAFHLITIDPIQKAIAQVLPSAGVAIQTVIVFLITLPLSIAVVLLLQKSKWTSHLLLGK